MLCFGNEASKDRFVGWSVGRSETNSKKVWKHRPKHIPACRSVFLYLLKKIFSNIITHVHLKANPKLALHDKDDGDEAHSAEHHPQQQLGRGEAADTVADIDVSLSARLCEEHLGVGVELGEGGEVGDPGGVVGQLDIVLGWLDSCGCLSGRVLIVYHKG